jgi:hypothetical protein
VRYLVWSNHRGAWVRPQCNGYTGSLDEAGYFTAADAERIVALENCGGPVERVDPFTNRRYVQYSAVIMPEPQMVVMV